MWWVSNFWWASPIDASVAKYLIIPGTLLPAADLAGIIPGSVPFWYH